MLLPVSLSISEVEISEMIVSNTDKEMQMKHIIIFDVRPQPSINLLSKYLKMTFDLFSFLCINGKIVVKIGKSKF